MILAKDIYQSKVCFNLKICELYKASSLQKAGSFLNINKIHSFSPLGSLSFGEGWGEEKQKTRLDFIGTGFLMN
jgi:hypothetical protein